MKNGVRNTLRVLAGIPLAFLLGIAILLIVGTDRSPLPDRESLLAHIESPPPDQDAFPLWRDIFNDQYDHVDYNVRLMLGQHSKWDAEAVRQQAEKFDDTLSAIHDLRNFSQVRSNYATESNGYSLYVTESTANLVIAAGLLEWHDGRRTQASERFRDAAHLATLLYRDGETTLASQNTAMHIVLTLVTTLQRPIANSSDPEQLALLKLVTDDLPEVNTEMQLAAFRNEKAAFLVSLIDQVELPFFRRVGIAAEVYQWSSEHCERPEMIEESYCRNRFFNFLALVFPRFYTHWQPLDSYLEARYEEASHMLRLPCSAPPAASSIETPAPHWSDYFTPNSSLARMEQNNYAYRRLMIDQCLTDFFISSQQIAAALKAHELETGKVAGALDVAMQGIPKDPFSTDAIHYDVTAQLLWSAGVNGDAETGNLYAMPPLEYTADDKLSDQPTYLLNPGPIPEPEESKSRCKQDPDIGPLEPVEEQAEDEQTEAI